eukprot:6254054-Amphidinium_carterae.1
MAHLTFIATSAQVDCRRLISPSRGRYIAWVSASQLRVPAMMDVRVYTVSGESFVRKCESRCKVAALKGALLQEWHIPVQFQRLCVGTVELQEDDELGDHCSCIDASWQCLIVTLVLTISDACACLQNGHGSAQYEALDALSILGKRGGAQALASISVLLGQANAELRQSAMHAFLSVSEGSCDAAQHV